MPIQHISDTALLTAYARAKESERQDALFRDVNARALAGDRGEELALKTDAFATIVSSVACRTRVFDDLLVRFVQEEQIDLVLNLGAGLDARPWRLDLPSSLRWVDVDLPEILFCKHALVGHQPARCRYEAHPADLGVAPELAAVIQRAGLARKALILSEGILVYLSEKDVAELATQLHSQPTIAWWITDVAGPRALPMMAHAWGGLLAGAQFRFAPPDPVGFFRNNGWEEVEFRSSQIEAIRLGRARDRGIIGRILWAVVPKRTKQELMRLSGVAIFHRAAGASI